MHLTGEWMCPLPLTRALRGPLVIQHRPSLGTSCIRRRQGPRCTPSELFLPPPSHDHPPHILGGRHGFSPETWLRVTQGNGLSSHHCGDPWGQGSHLRGDRLAPDTQLVTSSCDRHFTGTVCRVEPGRWEKGAGVGMKNDRGLSDQSPALSQRRHMQRRAGDTGQVCEKEDSSSRVLTSAPQPSLCVLASAMATPSAAPPWAHSSYGHRGLAP